MDRRRFAVNLVSNFFSALSGVGISFFLTPYIVAHLGKEAYGFFPLSNNFVMYAGIVTTALNSMSSRYITISLEKKDIRELNVYFNSILFGNLLISGAFLLLSAMFCVFLNIILYIPAPLLSDVRLLFVFILFSLIINVSAAVFSVAAFALNRFDKLAYINIISNVVKLCVVAALFYVFSPKIYFLGLVTLVTAIYMLFANYRLTKKLLPEVAINRAMFSWSALRLVSGFGMWNSVIALSNVINTQLDLLIANHFFGSSGMGFLSLTKFIPNAIYILLGIVVPIFLPEMLKAYAQDDIQKLKNTLNLSFKAIFMVVLSPLAVFFVYGDEFFRLWLPNQDATALHLLSIITLLPFIVHGTIETVHHVFVITNKLKVASMWGIFIALLNFVLVILLCLYSNFGIYAIPAAAAISGVFSHLTFTPLYAAYCLKEKWTYFLLKILRGLAGFTLLIAITYGWRQIGMIRVVSWPTFIINCLLIGLVLLVVVLAMLYDKKTLYSGYHKILNKIRS
ncbi:lipopolysaccharide biosynthesis protein [Pedobacter agri]|uniref:Lipopolysaccharide biosynthesis protein n=1 Tax=Pedobacter agri TaxID=454586 RepID=A0A9X3DCH2_9SPHI|nr:lipopolysaccharide biosynthesis protein [Pedobacter agri]MCX3264879.1 lipopolysaccharide biosynthesis protein [Pedobacter agri]